MNKKELFFECLIGIGISVLYMAIAAGLTLLNIFLVSSIPYYLIRIGCYILIGIVAFGCFGMSIVSLLVMFAVINGTNINITGEGD